MQNRIVPSSIGLGIWLIVGALVASLVTLPVPTASSREPDKTLKLFFGHTGERGEFTFKRNGRYDRSELDRINRFLRDWRRNEPAKMDPLLLDLIWAIYKETRSNEYIHVVSAYRSPQTNEALRKRSKGVAENSQHTHGKAMDFYIPGVPLSKLRAIALKFQGGGVGYYPTSGSPFVHVDTGSVRMWPRMSRDQLLAVFPNGQTLYVPADGNPLQGYDVALARKKAQGTTALAYLETGNVERSNAAGGGGNWLTRVFSGGADEEEDEETAASPPPRPRQPAAPPAESATGAPEVLIAGDLVDPRLPRRRPGEAAAFVVASLQDEAPMDQAVAAMEVALAPLPRERPDAALLASSLESDGPAALRVQPADAIALVVAEAGTPQEAEAPVIVAEAASKTTDADRAILTGFAAIEDAIGGLAPSLPAEEDAISLPRRRPVALAFAGAGLPSAEILADREPPQEASAPAEPAAAEPVMIAAPASASIEIASLPLPDAAYGADARALEGLIVMTAEPEVDPQLTMPEPAGAASLFAAADAGSAMPLQQAVATPDDHFAPAEAAQEHSERGFFSKLFASIVE